MIVRAAGDWLANCDAAIGQRRKEEAEFELYASRKKLRLTLNTVSSLSLVVLDDAHHSRRISHFAQGAQREEDQCLLLHCCTGPLASVAP